MSSFPHVPGNSRKPSQRNEKVSGNDAKGSQNKAFAPAPPSGASSGPDFKDQFHEVTPPIGNTAAGGVPIAEATPVSRSTIDDGQNSTEHQRKLLELEEQRLQLERERLDLQQRQQQPRDGHANGSGFNKKWVIIGIVSFLIIIVTSLSTALAIGNKSSPDTRGSQQAFGPEVPSPAPQPVVAVPPTAHPIATPVVRPIPGPMAVFDRATVIVDFVNSITLTMRTLVYPSQETPEEQALQWLIDMDVTTDVSLGSAGAGTSTIDEMISVTQRYVLATLWFGNGPFASPHANTWVTEADECTWLNVFCVNGEVTGLDLHSNGLSGPIPLDMGLLTTLSFLWLGENALIGFIPSEIQMLTRLTSLDLRFNQLDGSIPSHIGSLTRLSSLALFGNSLTHLTALALNQNQLGGSIFSQVGSLTRLVFLRLYDNRFIGTIPSQVGALTRLGEISLNQNQLTGSIPSQIGSLTRLTALSLWENQLNGSIPNQILWLTSLTTFTVAFNDLTGTMPFCDGDSARFEVLQADCVSEVACSCCIDCF